MKKGWLLLLTGLVALVALPALADDDDVPLDMTPATIRLGMFTRPVPMLAAQSKGFFAKYNLTVTYDTVASSKQQFAFVRDNKYDVVSTSMDNVVNYRLNPANGLGGTLDVKVIAGQDHGLNLSLVAQAGIATLADLRGKRIAVDAPDSGFAFVAYKILRTAGLEAGRDYTLVQAGGTASRFAGLLANQFDATLLNSGFDVRAVASGRVRLATSTLVIDPYQGISFAAKTAWLTTHRDVAIRFLRAYYEALEWSFEDENHAEAIALLKAGTTISDAVAEEILRIQLDEVVGLIESAQVDRRGLYNILLLRQEFHGFQVPQNLAVLAQPAGGLYDMSYLRKAIHDEDDEDQQPEDGGDHAQPQPDDPSADWGDSD